MMQHDILNDALSKIKNAISIGNQQVTIKPASKLIGGVLKIMHDFNYIKKFEYMEDGRGGKFIVFINTTINECGVIKPRFPVNKTQIEKFEARYLPAQTESQRRCRLQGRARK